MDDSISYYIILLVSLAVLIGFSAFFAACETAFSSLNHIKLKNISEKSKGWRAKRARLALKLYEIYDKVLSTSLFGNNAVNIASSALAAAFFIGLFGGKGVGLATLVMTVLLLFISDITPKTLAKKSPELAALRCAPVLRFIMIILTPFIALMSAWQKFIVKIFPLKQDRSTTDDEILTYMEEARQEGVINSQEEHMIRQVIELDDQKVSGIFTPRIDVKAVSVTSTVEEIDRLFIETGFSRLPVFQDSIDNIKGIIILKDFYHEVMKGLKTFEQIIKPVVFVPKTIKIPRLLRTMQEKKSHMAVVVDEHGGTLGIVTIEDIVEELVGEIWDEHDEVVEEIKNNGDGSYTVLGSANFDDMLEAVAGSIANNDEIPDTTIANWCMETLGRLPLAGETLSWRNLTIKVLRVVKQRIMEMNVTVSS